MKFDLSTIYVVLGTAVAVLTLIKGIPVFLASHGIRTTPSSTTKIYQSNNEALKEQNQLRLGEIQDLERQAAIANTLIAQQRAEINELKVEQARLRELVLQIKGMAELTKKVENYHDETMQRLDGILALVGGHK